MTTDKLIYKAKVLRGFLPLLFCTCHCKNMELFRQFSLKLLPVKHTVKVTTNSITPAINCASCYYWSGRVGNKSSDLICAVAVPRPTEEALQKVGGQTVYASHNCQDFRPKN